MKGLESESAFTPKFDPDRTIQTPFVNENEDKKGLGPEKSFESREDFDAQVRVALTGILKEYQGQGNLLRPKINACLEDFGVGSRQINLQISPDSTSFSVEFMHKDYDLVSFEI